MPAPPGKEFESFYDPHLKGTTYRVYRYMVKSREPVGISAVQTALGLSSSSVSEYHIKKLLRLGLIKEVQGGYLVDKVVLDNMVRIMRISIPIQVGYIIFFGVTLLFLILFLRPNSINSLFFFALVINTSALLFASYETAKTLRRWMMP
jgi:predicted DNA-binding transcriptional regulator